jgi:hypothetical protein
MSKRWTRFGDERLQSLLVCKARQFGVGFSLDAEGRVWFEDGEWCRAGDPHILTLDGEFGPEWVAVYADDPAQRAARIQHLAGQGIRFVVWFDAEGTYLVLRREQCPSGWEYS